MYGALTGLSKKMIAQSYGEAQFMAWRRGYRTRPPPASSFSPNYPGNDDRYLNGASDHRISVRQSLMRSVEHRRLELHRKLPKTESLRDCMKRTIPYFSDVIKPDAIDQGRNVLIASSENAIRGLLMHLCDIPPERISELEIPTGVPLVYSAKRKCVRLLSDRDPSEYDFGTGVDLIFRPCLVFEEDFITAPAPADADGDAPSAPPVGVAEKLQPVPTWSELLRSSEQEDVKA